VEVYRDYFAGRYDHQRVLVADDVAAMHNESRLNARVTWYRRLRNRI